MHVDHCVWGRWREARHSLCKQHHSFNERCFLPYLLSVRENVVILKWVDGFASVISTQNIIGQKATGSFTSVWDVLMNVTCNSDHQNSEINLLEDEWSKSFNRCPCLSDFLEIEFLNTGRSFEISFRTNIFFHMEKFFFPMICSERIKKYIFENFDSLHFKCDLNIPNFTIVSLLNSYQPNEF